MTSTERLTLSHGPLHVRKHHPLWFCLYLPQQGVSFRTRMNLAGIVADYYMADKVDLSGATKLLSMDIPTLQREVSQAGEIEEGGMGWW